MGNPASPVFTTHGLLLAGLGLLLLLIAWGVWPQGHGLLLAFVAVVVLAMVLRGWPALQQQWDAILSGRV